MQRRQMLLGLPALWWCPTAAFGATAGQPWHDDLPGHRLLGEGTFRWFGLRIYDAQMWVGDDWGASLQDAGDEAWQSRRFVLAFRYARAIRREQFVSTTLEEIERASLFATTAAQQQQWQAAMRRVWQDVQEGDWLCALNQPGKGCRFYNQYQPLGEIDDVEFARAFFAIWLHPSSRDAALRRQLLGVA